MTSVPSASATSAPTTPTPVPTQAPTSVAADGLPPIESTHVPAPNLAFWIADGETIHILLWDPMTTDMVETATVETWPGSDIDRTVLFGPNGAHFAVHEINVATSSPVQRVRIFDFDGNLVWQAPDDPRLPIVTGMAWSPDGTALAIGSLPVPWTLVQLSEGGAEPDVTTYELDDRDGYALLGFSEDANTVYGYGTGGEAEYWQKLVALNRATGRLASIDSIPPGPSALSWANSTALVDRFHPDGTIIVQPGLARNDPMWALRTPDGTDVPVPVIKDAVLTWGPDRHLVSKGHNTQASPARDRPVFRVDLIEDPVTGALAEQPGYDLPPGMYADLFGARDGYTLVLGRADEAGDAKEAVVIELATGRAAVGLPPARLRSGELHVAGWLGRRD
jgi:hypothetical protein